MGLYQSLAEVAWNRYVPKEKVNKGSTSALMNCEWLRALTKQTLDRFNLGSELILVLVFEMQDLIAAIACFLSSFNHPIIQSSANTKIIPNITACKLIDEF